MLSEQKKKAEEKMGKAIDTLRKEFVSLRTGRASLGMLDGIMVDYYGTPTPLSQVANLAVPDARQITIMPWEAKMLGEIEKAILKSDRGSHRAATARPFASAFRPDRGAQAQIVNTPGNSPRMRASPSGTSAGTSTTKSRKEQGQGRSRIRGRGQKLQDDRERLTVTSRRSMKC
jgi:hypothetical protein